MSDRYVSAVSLEKDIEQIVSGGGRIIRERESWSVHWTESRDGWVDVGHRTVFSSYGEARNNAYMLADRRLPNTRVEDILTEEQP